MSTVLTKGGQVTCTNPGAVSTVGKPRLKVAGQAVVVKAGIMGKDVTNCPVQDNTNPTTTKCTTVTAVSAGEATKLKVDGAPVILVETFAGTTNGTTPALTASDSQTKLTAV